MSSELSGGPYLRRPDTPDTLAGLIDQGVKSYPTGSVTEIDFAGKRTSLSFSEFHRRATLILEGMLEHNVADECEIVCCVESVLDFVPALWACIYGGYNVLPWHLAKTSNLASDITARLPIVESCLKRPWLLTTRSIRARFSEQHLKTFEGTLLIDAAFASGTEAATSTGTACGAPTKQSNILLMTSGTTSVPKIVEISAEAQIDRFAVALLQRARSRSLLMLPLDTVSSLAIACPHAQERYYIQPDRMAGMPSDVLRVVEDFGIESFSLASSMAARILDAADQGDADCDLSSLRHVGFGLEAAVPGVVDRLGRAFKRMGAQNLKISFGYGMTETSLISWSGGLDAAEAARYSDGLDGATRLGGITDGLTIRIVDDQGALVPEGQAGQVEVSGTCRIFSGYRAGAGADQGVFTTDGWFKTGDLGLVDNGCLVLNGRKKSIIIVNGRNVSLERIEKSLRQVPGIEQSLLTAGAVRGAASTTDELALFFAASDTSQAALNHLCRGLARASATEFGLAPGHLVPVRADEFPVTRSGKIKREALVSEYMAGRWAAYTIPAHPPGGQTGKSASGPRQALAKTWQSVLKLNDAPQPQDDFFESGGDSLASAELIFVVEQEFNLHIPVERFYRKPEFGALCDLVRGCMESAPEGLEAPEPASGRRLLHKLHSYSASWRGERLFPESLVVGANCSGPRPPIFWTFQGEQEFSALAGALGPEQPLYGMRSCHQIVPVKDYSADVLETVANRYLWEILSLPAAHPIVIGGNCQGAILALSLARLLKLTGRPPALLVLMEWSYSFGPYDGRTLFVYGEESYTADIFGEPQRSGPDWQRDFPDCSVGSIPGAHGAYFSRQGVDHLAATLNRTLGSLSSEGT